jgi:hypothetical protein
VVTKPEIENWGGGDLNTARGKAGKYFRNKR